jgi:hypothetical protein
MAFQDGSNITTVSIAAQPECFFDDNNLSEKALLPPQLTLAERPC